MFRGHQKMLTELLQESLIQLCSKFLPQNVDIEIDGLVCIGLNGSNEQVVLKIHKVIQQNVTSSACYRSDGDSPVNLVTDQSRNYSSTEADTSLTTTVNIDCTRLSNRPFKVWKCKSCQTVFRRFADYDDHVRQQHEKFACNLCDQCFTLSSNLKRHSKLHTGLKPFKCHRCHVAFSRKSDLRIHWRRHYGDDAVTQHDLSPECSVGTNANINTNQSRTGSEELSSFVVVKAETNISDDQNSETIVKIEDNSFEVHADSNNPTPSAQTHIFFSTSASEGSASVEPSSSQVKYPSFEITVKEDVDERTFECCSQTWQGFHSYENHVLSRHSRFPCHLCHQTFTSHNNRRRHVTCNHGGGKKFECNICEKHFTRPDIVKEHKLIHTRSYRLKECSHCGFTSEKKTALLAHLKKCFGYKNIDADIDPS